MTNRSNSNTPSGPVSRASVFPGSDGKTKRTATPPMAGGPGLVKKIDEFLDFASAKSTAASGECVQKKRAEYARLREEVVGYEKSMGFEYACTTNASDDEKRANKILQDLRKADITNVYDKAAGRVGYHGQVHRRFYGDHFLSNVKLIEQTQVFRLLRAMPKGAHLHIHFNANLHPLFLLNVAKTMDRMFVWSDKPLVREGCQLDPEAMNSCRLQFRIMDEKAAEGAGKGNMLSPQYRGGTVMRFQDLVNQLVARYSGTNNPSEEKKREAMTQIDRWLHDKVVFHEEEAHNSLQTAQGAWEKFNARTQFMKGLFNYETAYRKYTRKCLEDFADDNIQYAEIRPNFMSTNQVWKDDGSGRIDNDGIMNMIIDEYEAFQRDHQDRIFKGLKVIYCTPRSFSEEEVRKALDECLRFKQDKRFSSYIAGFDLVGEEGKGRPLRDFRDQFIWFQSECAKKGVHIPFLFHCGETLDVGTDTDGNLVDALVLGSKRIGHGFALPRHPGIMRMMKERNVCVEVCPISNEILGLTPRISGHAVYSLLAENMPCTINTDNGTLFRSRLSHDFYQILAGKADMTLHGLRQLAEWSIEHSCMERELKERVLRDWRSMWDKFCKRIINGDFNPEATQAQGQSKQAAAAAAGAAHPKPAGSGGTPVGGNTGPRPQTSSSQRSSPPSRPGSRGGQKP